ncbi:MAG: hypothetical protein ABSA39_01495 [Edaphobacter sp.]
MSFPRYERYKDSGVEWLGAVPEHWEVTKVKRVATKIGSGKTPRGGSEVYVSEGVIFLRSQNVHDTGLRLDDVVFISPAMDEEMDNTRVQAGDILLNVTGGSIGRTSVVPSSLGAANVSQHVCIIRIPDSNSRDFLATAIQGSVIRSQIELVQNGAARDGLNFEQIGNLVFALPSSSEEFHVITNFLHHELEQIDTLIDEQRRLIDFLKEKRQAMISHAVTNGIDPSRATKPSGVGWLGNIPVSWAVVGSRRLFRLRNERAWASDQQLTASQKYGMLFQSEFVELEGRRVVEVIQGTDSLRHVEPNDFVISLRSFQGGIEWCKLFGSVTFHYVVLAPIKNVHPPFFAYLFKSMAYIQALRSTTNLIRDGQDLRYSHFVLIDLPLVPIEEQREIASYLDQKIPQIDELSALAHVAIERLQERRSALISEVVTGKIDVRAYMAKPVMNATRYSSGFAHQLLAAEILDRYNSQRMGRIKLQKLIHLCEYHGQVSELQGDYSRKAAGPFDARAMAGISKNLKKQKWFEEVKEGERYVYRPLEKRGEHKKYLTHWQHEMPRIDEVLSLLGNFRTRECEIISTLYAAWNDLLIDGGPTDDASILHEASSAERWHKSKEQIAPERWKKALQWMKDKGLAPVGYGKHTRHTAGQIETTTEEAHEPA